MDRFERGGTRIEPTSSAASRWREDGSADGRMGSVRLPEMIRSAGLLSRVRFAEPGMAAAGKPLFRGDDR